MEGSGRLSLTVGAFVLACLAVAAYILVTLTSESGLFVDQYRIYGRFENVQGLLPGAPVWLAGKEVGRVEKVGFTEFGSESPIEVKMRVNYDLQGRIRSDSVASIGTIGVLGDSYVELKVGSSEGTILQDGASIPTISPTNIYQALSRGTRALDSVSALADNLNRMVDDVRVGGVVPKAASAVAAVSDIILQVEQGEGLIHSIIYDEYAGGGVESIERSLASLEDILAEVRSGEGLLHSLIFDPRGTSSAESIEKALVSLADILEEVRSGDGLLHSLVYDSESGQLTERGAEALENLNLVLARVAEGDGTLGLLVNDPTLYEETALLVGRAQRSALLRSLIKMAASE